MLGQKFSSLLLFLLLLPPRAFAASSSQERADRFLALANAGYQALFRVNSEAQWLAVTDVTPAHDAAAEATGKAYAAFNGNPAIISEARELLTHEKELYFALVFDNAFRERIPPSTYNLLMLFRRLIRK